MSRSGWLLRRIVSRIVGGDVRLCPDGVWFTDRASVSSRCHDGEIVVTIKTSIVGRRATMRLILADGRIYARVEPRSMFDVVVDYLDLGDFVGRMVRI